MSFWSKTTWQERLGNADSSPIRPYSSNLGGRVDCAAFPLTLGPEAVISDQSPATFKIDKFLSIPPGQFAMLLSEEEVTVPKNVIGFLSMKAAVKFKGLINVSGFHIDPGFSGRIKFSVYNAGAHSVTLQRGEDLFLVWFAELDPKANPKDAYNGSHNNQVGFNKQDIDNLKGELASPAHLLTMQNELRDQIENLSGRQGSLEKTFGDVRMGLIYGVIGGITVGALLTIGTIFLQKAVDKIESPSAAPIVQKGEQSSNVPANSNSTSTTASSSSPATPVPNLPPANPQASPSSSSR